MQGLLRKRRCLSGFTALFVAVMMIAIPLAGCSSNDRTPPPPVDDTRGGSSDTGSYDTTAQAPAQQRTGMSTKKKLILLAGAAALYYMYKKHQNAQTQYGPESQYYLSKNGRIYYRDSDGRAHWVTPPQEGIMVPESEARTYRDFQGYENHPSGMDLSDVAQDLAYDVNDGR
jgi:hypothetical protein